MHCMPHQLYKLTSYSFKGINESELFFKNTDRHASNKLKELYSWFKKSNLWRNLWVTCQLPALESEFTIVFFYLFFFDITTMDFIPFTWYVIVNSSRILYQNKSTNNSTMLRAAFIKKSLFRAVI